MRRRSGIVIVVALGAALLSGPDALANTGRGASEPVPPSADSSKYDSVDLDQILQSGRLLENYVKCLLNQGACQPDAASPRS